jgi:hypothetical protein
MQEGAGVTEETGSFSRKERVQRKKGGEFDCVLIVTTDENTEKLSL